MDIVQIQALIAKGRVVSITDIDPTQSFVQIGVYQPDNRKIGSANNTYPSFVIPLSELGGNQDLATTLAIGNTTGANDIIVDVDRQIKTTDTGFIQFGDTGADLNAIGISNGGDGVTTPANVFGFSGVDPYWTSQVVDIAGITDIISLDPQNIGNGTGIKSVNNTTNDYTKTIHTPVKINLKAWSAINDRDIYLDINNYNIVLSNSEISTGYSSSISLRSFIIESYVNFNDGDEKTSTLNVGSDILIRQVNVDTGDITSLTVKSDSMLIEGRSAEYLNDYSSTYTNRSLVDKEYVDNNINSVKNILNATIDLNTTADQIITLPATGNYIIDKVYVHSSTLDLGISPSPTPTSNLQLIDGLDVIIQSKQDVSPFTEQLKFLRVPANYVYLQYTPVPSCWPPICNINRIVSGGNTLTVKMEVASGVPATVKISIVLYNID